MTTTSTTIPAGFTVTRYEDRTAVMNGSLAHGARIAKKWEVRDAKGRKVADYFSTKAAAVSWLVEVHLRVR